MFNTVLSLLLFKANFRHELFFKSFLIILLSEKLDIFNYLFDKNYEKVVVFSEIDENILPTPIYQLPL